MQMNMNVFGLETDHPFTLQALHACIFRRVFYDTSNT